jgi:ABC-type multidrug transport system fused ATPase/permease subunit
MPCGYISLSDGSPIERSLFAFIWKHSKREQLKLLVVTLALFPLLYLTLELPKRIINDAIGAGDDVVTVLGVTFGQITFLMILCGLFLLSVLIHGALKMRINTMNGVLSERMLRRLRYTLIARILRFPSPYFERTSQGELVSMITAEAEPMGSLMGDAVAQPVLQAGQMLTILGFLFAQSIAFGVAACALIPLQAWIIPRMQRQINLLNRERVVEIRALASAIGESAAGATTLRLNRGWRYRLAMVSDRLGRLYHVRFRIYQKKFFMKFINNFIGQLTPFFFYAIGGYLAIRGEITVGALVAALAAYKDLSSPWKELLTYYNQTQDMAMRWETITERFAPEGMLDVALFEGMPDENPRLTGNIELRGVCVADAEGATVLDDLSVTFPAASSIAITAPNEEDRRAFAKLLTRELLPTHGTLRIGDRDLHCLHQETVASRIGYADSAPVLFEGRLGENINMALQTAPQEPPTDPAIPDESARTGNSTDPAEVVWLDPAAAGVSTVEELEAWWSFLIGGMELDAPLFLRSMDQKLIPDRNAELSDALVQLRPAIAAAVRDAGFADQVSFFDETAYNPALPVAENLIFAMPRMPITAQVLIDHPKLISLLGTLNLEEDLLRLAADIVDLLQQTFGVNGTDHPLFRKLGLEPNAFEAAVTVLPVQRRDDPLSLRQKAELLAVPFVIPAEKIGTAFPADIVARVLEMRHAHAGALQDATRQIFDPLRRDAPVEGLSVLENALFGRVNDGVDAGALRALVETRLRAAGLATSILHQLFYLPVTLGGKNLPAVLSESIALGRATVKRPDIVILDGPLASFDAAVQDNLHLNIRKCLPDTTLICLARAFSAPDSFDHQFVLQHGRLSGVAGDVAEQEDPTVRADLARKLRALENARLFSGLARKQLRLLAFGARWYHANAGDYVFRQGDDPSTGAFLVLEGTAELLDPREDGDDVVITISSPGELVGELGLIRGVPRALDMRAATDLTCLRIGAEDFFAVVKSDAPTAYKLLQVVAGYV